MRVEESDNAASGNPHTLHPHDGSVAEEWFSEIYASPPWSLLTSPNERSSCKQGVRNEERILRKKGDRVAQQLLLRSLSGDYSWD